MKYNIEKLIRFEHCDPAGIVFYPRYFELINQVVEDWFAEKLLLDFHKLFENRNGIPMVHSECDFISPSRLGERVMFELEAEKIGTSSCTLTIVARGKDDIKLQARMVLVFAEISIKGDITCQPFPDNLRILMNDYLKEEP